MNNLSVASIQERGPKASFEEANEPGQIPYEHGKTQKQGGAYGNEATPLLNQVDWMKPQKLIDFPSKP